jgi:outer membrane protein TolC
LLVREAIRDLQRSSDRIKVLNKTIEGAKDKVEFANVNFQLGRADNFDITDAQKDLIEAETDYIEEIVSYRIALARLEQLLGGTL